MRAFLTLSGEELPNLEVTIALPRKYCPAEGMVVTSSLEDDGYDCLIYFPTGLPGFLKRVIPSDGGIEIRFNRKRKKIYV